MPHHSRRSFLRTASAAGMALGFAPTLQARSASERVVVGLIGCGKRGRRFFEHADFVCDPDAERLGRAAEQAGVDSAHAVTDLRRLLDNKAVDAVVIATPDHWHAPAALLALEAGKHVYVEKPWSHNFRESQLLRDAARQQQLVVQHGTQQRSMDFANEAVAMLREGMIGEVLAAKAWNVQMRDNIGRGQPSEPPASLDYDLWVGPAEMVPFQSNRFHYHWHWWYNFGTGDVGNDGAHELDLARWGLGIDTLPSKVAAIGGKYFHDDDQEFPDTATCVFEFPGDGTPGQRRQIIFEMRLWSTNYPEHTDSGVEFYGTEGKLMFSKRGKLIVRGRRNALLKEERREIVPQSEHLLDFVDAIRTNRAPTAGPDEAHRSVALVHLANIAVRVGRSIEFDPEREVIVNDGEASQLLSRSYRHPGHWAVPLGV